MSSRNRSLDAQSYVRKGGSWGLGGAYSNYPIVYDGKYYWYPWTDLLSIAQSIPSEIDESYKDKSVMFDHVGRRDRDNFCSHTRTKYWNTPYRRLAKNGYGRYYLAKGYMMPTSYLDYSHPSFTWSQLRNARAGAYDKLIPSMSNPDGFSAFVSIGELSELKGAVRLATKGLRAIGRYWLNMFKTNSAAKFGDTLSNLTLMHDFGLRPMVRDAVNLAGAVKSVSNGLQSLRTRGMMDNSHHYTDVVEDVEVEDVPHAALVRRKTLQRTVYNASATLTWQIRNFDSKLEYLTRYYGADLSVGRVWELIPFSFMVDWFVNVGSALSSLDTSMRVRPSVSRFTESIKTTRETYIYFVDADSQYQLCWLDMNTRFTEQPHDIGAGKVAAYSSTEKYIRDPGRWPGRLDPFMHVRLPEFGGGILSSSGRLRDFLSLVLQNRR